MCAWLILAPSIPGIIRYVMNGVDLPNGDHVEEPAVDVPVEAPGTPVASSARGADGLGDIAVPAKAAMLQARVAELEVWSFLSCTMCMSTSSAHDEQHCSKKC